MSEIYEIPSTAPVSRSDQAYETIKRMIYRSELLPGQWLRKRELAAQLTMSPTPLIEAFRRLEHEGLVSVMPQWGARVRAWTVDEIAEGIEMRAALEGLVAARCAAVAEEDQIAGLRPLAIKVDRDDATFCDATQAPAIQPGMANTSDWRFHRGLTKASGLGLVPREIERLQLLQVTCRMFAFPCEPCPVSHVNILDAIADRDTARAEDLMRQHIRNNTYILPRLRQRFGDGPVYFQPSATPPVNHGPGIGNNDRLT